MPIIERFKQKYENWRKNPFTDEDLAVDKTEDNLYIPGSSPFLLQLPELPRKNTPASVEVRCFEYDTYVDQDSGAGQKVLYVASTSGYSVDDKIVTNRGGPREEEKIVESVQSGISLTVTVNLTYTHLAADADTVERYIDFVEAAHPPAQSQFTPDYPPTDGEGTGLVEFNQNDAGKKVRIKYKGTGSPIIKEFLDTLIPFPTGDPAENQIIAFKADKTPEYRYNPIRYFHEGSVIYHASGESESCLLFRFKKSSKEGKAYLELKGAKLHQGYYTELAEHNHGPGTLTVSTAANHQHSIAQHDHGAGSLSGSQANHYHTGNTENNSRNHWHSQPEHRHPASNKADGTGSNYVDLDGDENTGENNQSHYHSFTTNGAGDDPVTISGYTETGGPTTTGLAGEHNHSLSGLTANAGTTPKTYGKNHKVYINNVDKTAQILSRSGLPYLGDGTATSGFVVNGTGEIQIDDLGVNNGMNEIKITCPESGFGGRVLVHIELY